MTISKKRNATKERAVLNVKELMLSDAEDCATKAVPHINAVRSSISVPVVFFIGQLLLHCLLKNGYKKQYSIKVSVVSIVLMFLSERFIIIPHKCKNRELIEPLTFRLLQHPGRGITCPI